ncbi:hypothetical protein Srufu_040210 [Streptomyces libani subsp. rufus]|nr:hypothetical protein Srufu_040210 [Streptomyces libani subsp. rufus]
MKRRPRCLPGAAPGLRPWWTVRVRNDSDENRRGAEGERPQPSSPLLPIEARRAGAWCLVALLIAAVLALGYGCASN